MSEADAQTDAETFARIGDLLARSAALFPARPALQDGPRVVTYRELVGRIDATRQELRREGVGAGDRVLILGANSVEEVSLLFAVSALGAWPVLVSARVAPAQLDGIVRHCDPCMALFVGARQGGTPSHSLGSGAQRVVFTTLDNTRGERSASKPKPEPRADRPEDDVAAMIYTSGTTGVPKGAMLSHRNLVFIGVTQRRLRRYTEIDKTYCPLPIAHVGALGILMCVVAAGACLRLARRFVPADMAAAIRDDGITVVPGLPPLHAKFVEWVAENPDVFDKGRVRLVTTASSPLYEPVKRAVEQLYRCPLQNAYGLTETTGVVFQVDAEQWRNDTSVGPAIPGISVRIAGSSGRNVPDGERGEILVRGPNVFLGYYRNPEATNAVLSDDGWLRTGDLGYLDASQAAFVTGRSTDAIKRSGYTIHPADIEAALNEHPGVVMSAVVQGQRVADEEVVAFVQPRTGSDVGPGALIAFLTGRVAPYELPGIVRLVPRVPTLGNGKIDKETLRRWVREGKV